jgi:general L-amino acid transport system permease protein
LSSGDSLHDGESPDSLGLFHSMVPVTSIPAIPFWRDVRVIRVALQIGFVLILAAAAAALYANLQANLARRGIELGYGFLVSTAGFDIGESFIPYAASDTYGRALLVGYVNTIVLAVLGILFATILGVLAGIARLSSNYLIRQIAAGYVGLIRNTPLLIQLLFWYFAITLQLPPVRQALELPGPIYVSQRGIYLTWPMATEAFAAWAPFLIAAVLSPLGIRWFFRWVQKRTDRPVSPWLKLAYLVVPAALAIGGYVILPTPPLVLSTPQLQGLNFRGGLRISPEYAAMLFGLTVYTGAFIAEVVRAGIQSVSKGQVEAAHAVGLTSGQTLRLVVFPQALRVIIPPLTSQYLNLAKNTSLAIAIGYPDLFSVAGTVFNQTGTAIEILLLLMASYLAMSLLTSFLLNIYNRRVQLVER